MPEGTCAIASFTAWENTAKPTTVKLSIPGDEANDIEIELDKAECAMLAELLAGIGMRWVLTNLVGSGE